MALLTFAIAHYGCLALLALISYLIGWRLTSRIVYRSVAEEVSICITLGLGVLAYVIFGLGIVGQLYPTTVALTIGLLLALAYPAWAHLARRLRMPRPSRQAELATALMPLPLLFGLFYFMMPLYPAWQTDATLYHLPYAKLYVQYHQIILTPYLRYPVFPQVNEMLFTLALLFYDDVMAHLIQFLMMLLVGLTIYAWGQPLASRRVAVWGAILWVSNPLVLPYASSAYIDVGLTLFVTQAIYCFWRWQAGNTRGWLALAAFFCGCAAGTKYLGLFFPLSLGLVLVYLAVRRRTITDLALFVVVTALVALPWYARNTFYTGNPLFPFHGASLGDSALVNAVPDSDGSLSATSPGVAARVWGLTTAAPRVLLDLGQAIVFFLRLDIEANVRLLSGVPVAFAPWARVIGYPLSPLLLLILPALLLLLTSGTHLRRLLVLALVYTIFWYSGPPEIRYLFPVAPLLCLALAALAEQLWRRLAVRMAAKDNRWMTAAGVVLLLSAACLYANYKIDKEGPVPVTQAERDSFLAARLPSYPAYKLLNERYGRNYTLYALYDASMAYFADGAFMGDWEGPAGYDLIEPHFASGQALYAVLRGLGATSFLVRGDRGDVTLPQDEFFQRHFKLLYANEKMQLFELVEQPV